MPELPEVETTCRGITPEIQGKIVQRIIIRQPQLRWPIPLSINDLKGQRILNIYRRAKYILLETEKGTAILHLGMSGSLRIVKSTTPPSKHDHVDIVFNHGKCLRFTDPRRFGALLWTTEPVNQHPLFIKLGPEPFSDAFSAEYLWHQSRRRRVSIKQFIMDAHVVVGVGNIYASESLYMAAINPHKKAGHVSKARYQQLAIAIREVLSKAIRAGGTTLKDFSNSEGKPGYFAQQLQVYGRENEPCLQCKKPIKKIVMGQRSTFYCTHCQK